MLLRATSAETFAANVLTSDEKQQRRARKGFTPHPDQGKAVIEPEDLPECARWQKVLVGETPWGDWV
ncbi:MAG: hypothetical protein Q4G22_00090 [Paracoccus sp. (in: a-proteobacteria)]|uniref:hypothetical protein n=1 Tax=Paracoccus sp. TaxID=267 RepID=UPI0026E0A51E|nr:hypothetical protein [Paracoccus sp. (in: a-proteobacteria)]MDO5630217.1 hypothetical protein [Paracoccus sp. (in: a-proteobacteria)]